MSEYDPFIRGPFTIQARTTEAHDASRDRMFKCEIWNPTDAGGYPLVVYSHPSGGNRRSASFLCEHICSHGYVVAAVDHSETFVPELAMTGEMAPAERTAQAERWIASRVPDVRFVMDYMLKHPEFNTDEVGLVGHSFGGWTVLATPEVDPRIKAVVALAPAGNSKPRPGILKASLTFDWRRNVPTLYLAAARDIPIPLDGIYELMERTRASKRLFVLRRSDHAHFLDNVEQEHERIRTMPAGGDWAYMQKEMQPIEELCSGEEAHLFARGLTVAHFDAVLKGIGASIVFWDQDIPGELKRRGVDAFESVGAVYDRAQSFNRN
jgi:predicted dienelactone hydrolase